MSPPEHSSGISNAVYNLPIYINGKCVRVLFATNKVIDPTTTGSILTVKVSGQSLDLPEDGALKIPDGETGLSPQGERVVNRISKRPLGKNDILQLNNSDPTSVLARGIAQMEIAQRALENACEELQSLEGSRLSVRVSKSIEQRTKTLHISAKAISKFAKENTARKSESGQEEKEGAQEFCEKQNSFVDGEAFKYMEEDPLRVLRLDEEVQIGKTIEWFDMMEPKTVPMSM